MLIRYIVEPIKKSFRFWVRGFTRPVVQDEAEEKREFFAKLYCLSALVTFTYCMYLVNKRNIDFPHDPNVPQHVAVAQKFNATDLRVLTFKGFNKVSDFQYSLKEDKSEEQVQVQEGQEENLSCSIQQEATEI